MVSAFEPAFVECLPPVDQDERLPPNVDGTAARADLDEETEDEEVKRSCIGGLRSVHDSDMSDGNSIMGEDSESESDADDEIENDGVVNFASNKDEQIQPPDGVRKPMVVSRLPQQEEGFGNSDDKEIDDATSDDDGSDSSESAARGMGLSLETTDESSEGESSESEDDNVSASDSDSVSSQSERRSEDMNDASDDTNDTDEADSDESDSEDDGVARGNMQRVSMGSDPGPLRRPSLHFDELDEIFDDDSASMKKVDETPFEELDQLVSDALEFDYWSADTLGAVVEKISPKCRQEQNGSSTGYQICLPNAEDADFWVDQIGGVVLSESRIKVHLEKNPEQRIRASKLMFRAFRDELMSLDLARITLEPLEVENSPEVSDFKRVEHRLFVGSFSAAESRLALAVLNVKRIVQISYHPLDELWVQDGIEYSTHILPSLGKDGAAPVHEAIEEAAKEISSSIEGSEGGTSVLVTCTTGDEHSCAVCAAYLAERNLVSIGEAIAMVTKYRSSCRVDPDWLRASDSPVDDGVPLNKPKRVLSSNYLLSNLGGSSQSLGFDSPKRLKCVKENSGRPPPMPSLPSLCLGPAAELPTIRTAAKLEMRGSEDYMSSSAEEEEEREQDLRLSEELKESDEDLPQERTSTPVPLLTPPASPVRVESDKGPTTVCEWPSNLAVDSAMTAAIDLRPLSPNSLQRQEEEEERRIGISMGRNQPPASTLTPLIKGISVNFD